MVQMFTLGSFARFLVDEVIVNADAGRKQALEIMARRQAQPDQIRFTHREA
jgi:hypothetical protein